MFLEFVGGNTVHWPARFERSFFLFCLLFVFVVVCLVLFSLVAAAFLANKDVYKYQSRQPYIGVQ